MAHSTRRMVQLAGFGVCLGLVGALGRLGTSRRGGVVAVSRAQAAPSGLDTPGAPPAHSGGGWLAQRGVDLLRWPFWLLRAAPARSRRLVATLRAGRAGWITFLTDARMARQAGDYRGAVAAARECLRASGPWLAQLSAQLFDLVGGPEATEIALRGLTDVTPLSALETAEGRALLGTTALQWHEVRIAQGGVLAIAFRANKQRAFTLWHTINLPGRGPHTRDNLPIVMHELVHVYQYEKVGSAYVPQALEAQRSAAGYGYGLAAGLESDRVAGLAYRHYNREQQAQIIQDYFSLLHPVAGREDDESQRQQALACYAGCVAEMRAGLI